MDNACAKRNVAGNVGMSGEESGGSSALHVFDMHQLEPAPVLLQKLHRILAGMHYPKDVHLEVDKLRLCLGHHQVEQRAIAVWQELISVRVIKELQPMFGERFTSAIENHDSFATGLFIKGIFMRNPGAAGILQS